MSQLLWWPCKYFFYPIGNTSAISLTPDLPLDERANMLLLGCGDPRNVLFTIFNEPLEMNRKLDFTCCDHDPAVLARNVLLFSMIHDNLPAETLWNTFFHFRLDAKSKSALIQQCHKLYNVSATPASWRSSKYGAYIKMATGYTLSEMRRHWKLYFDMDVALPAEKRAEIEAKFRKLSRENPQRHISVGLQRSAGPLAGVAASLKAQSYQQYWKTGTTLTDSRHTAAAMHLNPTFVYSLGEECTSLHYGTDPLTLFHSAPLFANAKKPVSLADLSKYAKEQFQGWCTAYRVATTSTFPPVIRFIVGEATAVCHALRSYQTTGTLKLGIPVAQWKTTLIHLSMDEYTGTAESTAPSAFDAIHTSNLEDHMGLLNVIISAVPLLAPSPFSVLYTESLLHIQGNDATKEFVDNMKGDITVLAILTGLVPVDYLCGFSSRSNTHELMGIEGLSKKEKADIPQFHQVTTWKAPTSGDGLLCRDAREAPQSAFDPDQLGTFLYDVYDALFAKETSTTFWDANAKNTMKAIRTSNLAHYTRETFVLLLKLVRNHLRPSEEDWTRTMDRFVSLQLAAWSLQSMDTLHYQSLMTQFLRHGVYRSTQFLIPTSKRGPFSAWPTVPSLVRIILKVPRHELAILTRHKAEEIGSPPLQCDVFGQQSLNQFTSIHVAFGNVLSIGTPARPQVTFEEDYRGWQGNSPLVVSFIAPSWLLVDKDPPTEVSVALGIRNTPAACMTLIPKLGMSLRIFEAKVMDSAHVFVLPEGPLPSRFSGTTVTQPARAHTAVESLKSEIGTTDSVVRAEMDEQCELVAYLTAKVSVTQPTCVQAFCFKGSPAVPEISQPSPCIIRLTLEGNIQDIAFPFPVQMPRLRLARTSRWIEIVAPTSRSFLPDGMKTNPYPVIYTQREVLHPWSLHRVNIAKLPILHSARGSKKSPKGWYDTHIGSMLSRRERSLRKKEKPDAVMYVKDSIHSIFKAAARTTQSSRGLHVFSLVDEELSTSSAFDTLIFVHRVRFDLAFHTLVCDAHVVSLTEPLLDELKDPLACLEPDLIKIPVFAGEMQSWKQLLPALVERCRVTWSHTENCEYKSAGRVPLTEDMLSNPLCSCGQGQSHDGFNTESGDSTSPMDCVEAFNPFAPYATRIALSPLFAVSYLETVGRSPAHHKCAACREKGKPKLRECTGCQKIRYCSEACQKKHWKTHKPKCKGK